MNIKSILKKIFVSGFGNKSFLINDRTFVRLLYFLEFGRFPNLTNPKTFNEHICRLKISDKAEEYWRYTDKFEVRKYVEEKIGSGYLNGLIGVYEKTAEIPFDNLPDKYVLKATHGSGYNIIVTDKAKADKNQICLTLDKWLEKNYYTVGREKNYKLIKPRIVAENFIEGLETDLREYKFFCFKGNPEFVVSNKFCREGRFSTVYDMDFKAMDVIYGYPKIKGDDMKPASFDEMKEISCRLASEFDFVRVDLYADDKRIIFSELTFSPGGGIVPFKPQSYDFQFGKLFGD